jgi:predicted nucleotidyltransferase
LPKFDEVEPRSVINKNENGTSVKCISLDDLLHAKETVARGKDEDDIKFLKAKKKALEK